MILQALARYYDILSEDEDSGIPVLGYSRVNVSYVVNLSKNGIIQNIIPLKILDSKGKKYIPISMVVPEQEKGHLELSLIFCAIIQLMCLGSIIREARAVEGVF